MAPVAPLEAPKTTSYRSTVSERSRSFQYLSYAFLAFVCVIALDVGARVSFPYWPINHYDSPNRSWIYWSVRDFKAQPKAPDIVLMGSSLMLEALNTGDATYLHAPQTVTLHHTSYCLQDDIEKITGKKPSVFSFAIAGQMASDAYAITSTLLKDKSKPNTIVYGIAPRDFMDNTLTNVGSTETFRYLSRVGDLHSAFAASNPPFWDTVDNSLSQISFLYEHRADFLCLQQQAIKNILNLFGKQDYDNYHVPFNLRKIAMVNLPEDVACNETQVNPYGDPPVPYLDNLPEYKQRYAHMNNKMFKNQLLYLGKLLQFGKQQNIRIVLVNMPLTADNVSIMPTGFYDQYLQNVSTLASQNNAQLIDFNDPKLFNRGYFADSAHLNGLGGIRFFELLSEKLADLKH